MTTKPKAKKFRIRRSGPLGNGRPRAEGASQTVEDGFGGQRFPTAAPKAGVQVSTPADRSTDEEIAAIRREGLTGRQLRMARRVAQKHGLAPTSDFDAVRLLRKNGIDPFHRANMLELVADEGRQSAAQNMQPQLPQTVPPQHRGAQLPSTEVMGADGRAREIMRIQKDIARRRRRRFALLITRLAFFVMLPTLLAGYYYFFVATPMYATKSEFVIQQAESQVAGGLGSMFAGTGLAVQQDSIAVQSYLQSRDAMRRLDADLGFKAHFSQPRIDPIQQLEENASLEAAYKIYERNVKIGYDPTEGILKMEVIAADPETSAAFSEALISYAEERVDGLTQRLREDQMAGARASFREAEAKVEEAQKRVLDLQERLGVLDPATETSALMSQISTFEVQLQEKKLQLQQLLDNPRPNSARVEGVRGDIKRLEALVAQLRASMTESTQGTDSLARISAELRIAEADLANRQLLLQQALQQLETARIEANRQVRYLSLGVSPVAPDEPTYPRAFENTLLAFLIFGGIYLMISMTASILREQVSA
ncbi:MAG: capsule biosynthesis protein [Paracoccaceae bacterium]